MSLMSPTRARRSRRNALVASVLSATLGTLGSCGGADRFELTLRARDAEAGSPGSCLEYGDSYEFDETLAAEIVRCSLFTRDRRWAAADGRRAISPVPNGTVYITAPVFGDVVCGGEEMAGRWWSKSGPELPAGDDSFELEIDDGNSLLLAQQTGVWASDYDELLCFEGAGHWRGTAGELLDRTGTFTIRYDSIQTVLRLVED